MRVLVCGSRAYSNWQKVHSMLDALHKAYGITQIIQGCAQGADFAAWTWATKNNIPAGTNEYKPEWDAEGKSAGIKRNIAMLQEESPHLVIGFPGDRGTEHMTEYAAECGVPTMIVPDREWLEAQIMIAGDSDLQDALDVTIEDEDGVDLTPPQPTAPWWLHPPSAKDKWSRIVAPSAPTPADRYVAEF